MSKIKGIMCPKMSASPTTAPATSGVPAKANDAVRDAILRHLYAAHQRAKSPRSTAVRIRDLQRDLKTEHGFRQQEVASNLDYLIQKGWAVEVIEERTFQTPRGTTQQAQKVTYKISDAGIDRLEGASMYQRPDLRPHVNITNLHGITVVGDGNLVNADFTELSRTLTDLRAAVLAAGSLDDETRLNVASDIDTLQTQLQKTTPDRSIIQRAWQGIQVAVTAGELAELIAKAAMLIGPLIT